MGVFYGVQKIRVQGGPCVEGLATYPEGRSDLRLALAVRAKVSDLVTECWIILGRSP